MLKFIKFKFIKGELFLKIIVLTGGFSFERDVAISSGTLISNALIENGHEVMLYDLYLGSKNIDLPIKYFKKEDNFKFSYRVKNKVPNLEKLKELKGDDELIGRELFEFLKTCDKVFLALHGGIGENGKLQALLDILNIKYNGTKALGSMLAMHKDIAKRLMVEHNILTPKWQYINLNNKNNFKNIGFPAVLKPCSNGSSIGIKIINNIKELKKALKELSSYDNEFIIEEKIIGREFTVGILKNKALPVIEIIPKEGFYDYKNKYQKNKTEEICPAKISPELTKRLQKMAIDVHKILHLNNYSRIDFLVDVNENIYCLEANTLPGMTPTSLLPLAAKAKGIDYNKLCEILIN